MKPGRFKQYTEQAEVYYQQSIYQDSVSQLKQALIDKRQASAVSAFKHVLQQVHAAAASQAWQASLLIRCYICLCMSKGQESGLITCSLKKAMCPVYDDDDDGDVDSSMVPSRPSAWNIVQDRQSYGAGWPALQGSYSTTPVRQAQGRYSSPAGAACTCPALGGQAAKVYSLHLASIHCRFCVMHIG